VSQVLFRADYTFFLRLCVVVSRNHIRARVYGRVFKAAKDSVCKDKVKKGINLKQFLHAA